MESNDAPAASTSDAALISPARPGDRDVVRASLPAGLAPVTSSRAQATQRAVLAAPTELDLRRKRKRRPLGAGQSLLTVLDGPRAGEEFESALRDFALQQTIFLLKSELRVGQRIEIDGPGAPRDPLASTDPREAGKPVVAEVVRSRLLSNGRWEIVAERVKASAAPKISESQRRHERRRQRLAQQGVILNTTMRPIATPPTPKDEPK